MIRIKQVVQMLKALRALAALDKLRTSSLYRSAFLPAIAGALVAGAAVACASSANAATADYRDYGFSSAEQMRQYLTITTTEIEEITTPHAAYDLIIQSGLGPIVAPTPSPTVPAPVPPAVPAPTPAPGTILIPSLPGNTFPPSFPTGPVSPTLPRPPGVTTGNPVVDILLNPGLVDSWVTIGMRIWSLIAANRPVANVTTQRVAVLPTAAIEWTQMENWKGPAAHTYVITKKNMWGNVAIQNTYTVAFNYAGQVNGKGAFIANATIIPTKVVVNFGMQLNADALAGSPVNVGTKESPVAGVELQIRYKMDSFFNHTEGVDSFFLNGNGEMNAVNPSDSRRIN